MEGYETGGMNLNRKWKGVIAAVLAVVMLISAFAVLPAVTSANKDGERQVVHEGYGVTPQLLADRKDAAFIAASELAATPDEPTEGEVPADATEEIPAGTEATAGEEPVVDATSAAEAPATPNEQSTTPPVVDPDVVGAVESITRTDPAEDAVALEWNAVEDAQGYHVYWHNADAESGSYSLLATVKDTTLTIRNLKKGAMYCFKIAAYRTHEGTVVDGESASLTAGTMPVGVTNFRLVSGVPTGTVLRWNRNSLCDGYVLYRQFNGEWTRYQVLGRDVVEFCDTNVIPGRAYNYRICTYRTDSSGTLESTDSLVRTICGLCAPADNGTTTLLRKMYFKWTKNAYAQGYEVRYSSDNQNFTVLKDTTATSYTSNRFIDGKHYYFRIYPYRTVAAGGDQIRVYGTYLAKDLTITNSAYGKTVPNTYIEVSISQQHMWYYIDGELYVSTDIVTGNYNTADTPKGYWSVNSKCSPCTLIGADYVSYVDYWMAFIGGGYGIHDASWRDTYGGQIYKGNGSHGCINTPYAAVKKMYAKVTIGTPVIVY